MFPPEDHLGIKICGVTRPDQLHDIILAGADATGINLWPKSKRYLPLEQAREWLPPFVEQTTLVAVMVNPDQTTLDEVIASELFHILQLHGDEPPEVVRQLMRGGHRVIKALQVRDEASLSIIDDYSCQDILLDAYNPGTYGGAGAVFPWHLAVEAKRRFPERRIILSGGLTPLNVREAVTQVLPHAVDVASGVECSPGMKDMEQVRLFIREALS